MSVQVRSAPIYVFLKAHLITHLVRHEKPVENELSKQNIQDRYHGRSDPVAHKILNTHAKNMGLVPPEDQAIVSPPLDISAISS